MGFVLSLICFFFHSLHEDDGCLTLQLQLLRQKIFLQMSDEQRSGGKAERENCPHDNQHWTIYEQERRERLEGKKEEGKNSKRLSQIQQSSASSSSVDFHYLKWITRFPDREEETHFTSKSMFSLALHDLFPFEMKMYDAGTLKPRCVNTSGFTSIGVLLL